MINSALQGVTVVVYQDIDQVMVTVATALFDVVRIYVLRRGSKLELGRQTIILHLTS